MFTILEGRVQVDDSRIVQKQPHSLFKPLIKKKIQTSDFRGMTEVIVTNNNLTRLKEEFPVIVSDEFKRAENPKGEPVFAYHKFHMKKNDFWGWRYLIDEWMPRANLGQPFYDGYTINNNSGYWRTAVVPPIPKSNYNKILRASKMISSIIKSDKIEFTQIWEPSNWILKEIPQDPMIYFEYANEMFLITHWDYTPNEMEFFITKQLRKRQL